MPYPLHVLRRPPSPIVPFGILVLAALSAGLLPDVQWRESAALAASVAALAAAHARRFPTMLIAAAVAAGLAPAGLLLAPLCTGLAIRHDAARSIPVAVLAGALAALPWPWPEPSSRLPNLALVATGWPDALALIVATGVGLAAWLTVRAASRPTGPIFAEARLGALLLATVLPLPIGALGFLVAIAALPMRASPPRMAANDNVVRRTIVRLAA